MTHWRPTEHPDPEVFAGYQPAGELPRIGEYTPPVMQYAEAPEAPYVRAAEAIVEEVRTSLERGEGYPDQVPTALAMLAVSASLDALREMLADRLDTIGNALSELKD